METRDEHMAFAGSYSYLNTNEYVKEFVDNNHRVKIRPINNFTALLSFHNITNVAQNITTINGFNIIGEDITNYIRLNTNINREYAITFMTSYTFTCNNHTITLNNQIQQSIKITPLQENKIQPELQEVNKLSSNLENIKIMEK